MGIPSRRTNNSSRRRSSVAQEGNPLKDDPTLRKQLMQLDRIKSFRKFEPWKSSFLKRFESFLERDGLYKAKQAYSQFSKSMDRTVYLVNKCKEMTKNGVLTNERATVKGRHALNEMVNDLVVGWTAVQELIPGTGTEEEVRGYNKFMLGAVLVQDNFSEYERMHYVKDSIRVMSEDTLKDVADRVHLEQFANYETQFNRFCDVLGDLGLYEVMMACRKFTEDELDEEDSHTEEETEFSEEAETIILVDMKTASLFQMPLEAACEKGILSIDQRADEAGCILEACNTEAGREEIRSKLKKHPTLGLSTQLVIRRSVAIENEYTDLKEKEAVTNMWGVTLKSTNKKTKKNEELFFFDAYTGAVGQLDRDKAIAQGFIHETRNEFNALVLREAEDDPDEWEGLRSKVRRIIGIQMEEDRDDSASSQRYSTCVIPAKA